MSNLTFEMQLVLYDRLPNYYIVPIYFTFYFFWFMDCKCVSNRPSEGGKLLNGREGKGEVMSLEVAFKGGS